MTAAPFTNKYAVATLSPKGDEDWYKLPNYSAGTTNNTIDITCASSDQTKFDVYQDGSPSPVASDRRSYTLPAAAHTYEVRVHGTVPDVYSITFDALGDGLVGGPCD